MKNYEELKTELGNIGIAEWDIYSLEDFKTLEANSSKNPSTLRVCGAFSVFKEFLHTNFDYNYKDIDMQLCGIHQNRVGCTDLIPINDNIGFLGFSIIDDSVFAEIGDDSFQAIAYLKLINKGM